MMGLKRSFYKRGNGRIMHIPAALLDGMDVDAVSVERVAGDFGVSVETVARFYFPEKAISFPKQEA